MSRIVDLLDAGASLPQLVREIESGRVSEFVIARDGRPAARLIPLSAPVADRARRIGVAKGRFEVPDDIGSADEEVRRLFEGD